MPQLALPVVPPALPKNPSQGYTIQNGGCAALGVFRVNTDKRTYGPARCVTIDFLVLLVSYIISLSQFNLPILYHSYLLRNKQLKLVRSMGSDSTRRDCFTHFTWLA